MIDLHCHILPGIDDGPGTMDEALEMCRIAAQDGITTIVATPHFKPGKFDLTDISGRVASLQNRIDSLGIKLTILPGAEVTITPELPKHLDQYPDLTINRTRKFFLAEFPNEAVPPRWEDFLLSFLSKGFTPIITHPEKNSGFVRRPEALYPFVLAGGMIQITAMSILGENGAASRECCRYLLQHKMAHIIASDAHSMQLRPPRLLSAVKRAASIIGRDEANKLVDDIPRRVIAGQRIPVQREAVTAPRKRKWYHRMLDI